MSDLSIIPLEDGFETQLAQDWNGATGTVYVLDTPSYTPTTTNTYIVVNPGKTNMQIAEITDYDSTANTLTVSNVTLLKGLGINSTAPASSHATGSKVIISDNYQFWADIQTAINSKLDKNGNNGVTYATTAARDSALGADGVATLPYRSIYVTATGLFYNYNLSANAWQSIDTGTSPANATTSVAGLVRSDVAPAGIPVALIQDNPKYDALAGTSGTPSTSNKYVTNDDTVGTGSVVRASGITDFMVSTKIFGDASDGTVVFDGSTTILTLVPSSSIYTMTRDIYCNNMTVNVGVTIKSAGYRIFVAGTLTNNGTISNNGGNGGNATNAAAGTAGVGGTAGATPIAGVTVFSSGGAGTAGGNGRNTNGGGNSGTNPTSVTNSVGNAGGTGGTGGAGGANAGGNGGSSTATTSGTNGIKDLTIALVMVTIAGSVKAGTGGGGGGGGGVQENGSIGSGATGGGGGGGGAGGVVFVSCFALAGNGTITATGGTGGTGSNAFAGTATSTGLGGGSGGGGGAGGVVIIITKTSTNPNTTSVAAGTAGTGGTGQTTGGVVGANGVSGTTGGAGLAVYFVI